MSELLAGSPTSSDVEIKALTLTQPYATLMARGHKTVETRDWGTPYRGRLAIHAAKSFPETERTFAWDVFRDDRIPRPTELPRGSVVALVTLVECRRSEGVRIERELWEQEFDYGDWSIGRWLWITEDVIPVGPYPARGMLGLWAWRPTVSEMRDPRLNDGD